jgi:hypothetical protein
MSLNQNPNIVAFSRGLLIRKDQEYRYSKGLRNDLETTTLQAELMQLGFMLDQAAFTHLATWTTEDAARYFNDILPVAKELVGAKRGYRPFYRNFPRQVMDTPTYELMMNALRHYWSNGEWEPQQELAERGVAFEKTEFRPMKLVSETEFKQIFKQLVGVNVALTPGDRELVEWFIKWYGHDLPLPQRVPFKETLCILASFGLDVPVKTTTDVLRIARFISGGDPSLPAVPKLPKQKESKSVLVSFGETLGKGFAAAFSNKRKSRIEEREKFKFAHIRRSSRRYLLGLLEKTNLDTSEMQQRLEQWLRLGEILHPGEYQRMFPRTYAAFQTLRNQPPRVRTFHSQLEMALAAGELDQALALLMHRPGEFARRIDWFLRTYEDSEDLERVLQSFAAIASRISSKVLLELYGHLCSRLRSKLRSVSLKGSSKMKTLEALPPLKEQNVARVQQIVLVALEKLFRTLPPLGKVWIDERLKDVVLPTAMRSMNKGIATFTRGTRIPFRADAGTVRAFVHWYDQHGTEDIDLSAGFFDENFITVAHVSYTLLKHPELGACHSGDIRHRKGSCAEYIDIDIEKALKGSVRYVTLHVYNFNAGSLESLQECKFGLMERSHPESNEIFEPRTVSNALNLKNQSSSVLLCAIDLIDKSYLWLEVEMDRAMSYIENTFHQTSAILSVLVDPNRLTVHDLLMLHVKARGTPVENSEDADVRFAWEDFVADYAKIGEFMTVTPPEDAS